MFSFALLMWWRKCMLYNVPWQIHIKQEMTRLHGSVPILSGLHCCVKFKGWYTPSWQSAVGSFLFIDQLIFSVCSAPLAEVGPRRLAFGRFDMSVSLIILIRCSAGEPVCETQNDEVSKRWCQEGTHRTLILFVCISHSDASTEQRIVYVFLEKCASGHKFCHFEIIYHDVVIRGKWLSINWDNKLKCTGDHRLFKKRDFARVGE